MTMKNFFSTFLVMFTITMVFSSMATLHVSSTPLRANARLVDGVYTVSLPLGTPPQPQNVTITFTAPVSTVRCGSSAFQPSRSSTFRRRHGHSEDTLRLNQTNGRPPVVPTAVRHVAFRCGASGQAALGSDDLALPAQISRSLPGAGRVFTYCLPDGPLFLGGSRDGYFARGGPSGAYANLSNFFSHTTLHVSSSSRNSHVSGPYSISVRDIVVGTKPLDLAPFRLYISATTAYTRLEHKLYLRVRSAFRKAIGFGSSTPSVPLSTTSAARFDTCFNGTNFFDTLARPGVADIELKLSGGAVWPIFGWNSMVNVAGNVLCWAFVDAGVNASCVLGTYQQQQNLVEFDLAKSRLSFTGFLFAYRTSCGAFYQ